MLPDPIHPAMVHLPLVLAMLMPFFVVFAILATRRGIPVAWAWSAVLVLQASLVLSGWVATETGENEEEKVERVVAEELIEEHEEAAEDFLVFAGIGLLVAASGLLPGARGVVGRSASLVFTLIVLGMAIRVGHLGGELVYKHGAAQVYLDAALSPGNPEFGGHEDHDD